MRRIIVTTREVRTVGRLLVLLIRSPGGFLIVNVDHILHWRSVVVGDWSPVVLVPNRFRRYDILDAASVCRNPDARHPDSRMTRRRTRDDGSLLLVLVVRVPALGEDVRHVEPPVGPLMWPVVSVRTSERG